MYWLAQLVAMHVVHALLEALLHWLPQLFWRHVTNEMSGPDALGQLSTKHVCSQSGGDAWKPMPPTWLPQFCRHVSDEAHVAVPVPK